MGGPVADAEALHALSTFGARIQVLQQHWTVQKRDSHKCRVVTFGKKKNTSDVQKNYGAHTLCNRSYPQPCVAMGYGIENS